MDEDAINWAVSSLLARLPDSWVGDPTPGPPATVLLEEVLWSELKDARFVFPVGYEEKVGILSLEDRATVLYSLGEPLTIVRQLIDLRGAIVAETRNVRNGGIGLIVRLGESDHGFTLFNVRLPDDVSSAQRRSVRDALEERALGGL